MRLVHVNDNIQNLFIFNRFTTDKFYDNAHTDIYGQQLHVILTRSSNSEAFAYDIVMVS